jgi:hypothetical protein
LPASQRLNALRFLAGGDAVNPLASEAADSATGSATATAGFKSEAFGMDAGGSEAGGGVGLPPAGRGGALAGAMAASPLASAEAADAATS